jgi:hypothetical protein
MLRSLLPACLFLTAACTPRVELFGAPDASCRGTACPRDAGPTDAAPLPLGEPRFDEAGSPEDFRALAAMLDGDYHGLSVRGSEATRFEVRFTRSGEQPGRGRFRVHCVDDAGCDPFGPGSSAPGDGGRYDLVQLDARQRGHGELTWVGMTLPQVEFWNMTQDMDSLSFAVGYIGVGKEAGTFASILLSRGSWGDAGQPFQVNADAGADAALPEAGTP